MEGSTGEAFTWRRIPDVQVIHQRETGRHCTAQNSPYSFDIASYAVQGHNDILLEVYTGIARKKAEADTSSFGHSMSASVYNSLEPGGLMGPVTLYFKEK